MQHQCVRCNKFYEDGSTEIMHGCSCGGKFFFYINKKVMERRQQEAALKLTLAEREQIEKDACDIIGVDKEELDHTVVLDLETIRILQPGKFELDLVKLFNKKNPVVYKLEEGKYVIDIAESFKREKDSKSEGLD